MKETKIYNVIFPLWLIILYPLNLLFVIPANYLIDYLVLSLGAKHLMIYDYKGVAKKVIIKTWIFGFIADIMGGVIMMLSNFLTHFKLYDFVNAVMYNPFKRIDALLFVILVVIITAFIIYFLNLNYSFKDLDLPLVQKQKLALYLAIFTAPYLFLLPTMWFVR